MILFPVPDPWFGRLWWCREWRAYLFPFMVSWFNENLPFHQRNLWCGDDLYLLGKVQHIVINSLARTEVTKMWKGVWIHKEDMTIMWIL